MTYSTLLVMIEVDRPNAAVLQVAADLAERLTCAVIGIAACHPMQVVYADGYRTADLIEQDRALKEEWINKSEAEFRTVLGPRVANLEWRSSIGYLAISDYVAVNARAADLLLTSPARAKSMLASEPRFDLGALVIQLGRPALIVPHGTVALALQHIMIAWKDTRETRRAVLDALPLLRQADRITVAQVTAEADAADARAGLSDVVNWLGRHGVAASMVVSAAKGDDAGGLERLAIEHGVTFLVAGAYGHNRLREWAMGGVTRDLLTRSSRCTLLSH